MVHLRLTGVSEDGRKLLFVSDAGVEFTVDVDDRLRAALRGDQARLAQLEMQMDSTLRPRDIQARIRAGETPESVAQVAGTSVDKVMPYAAPVLAEREHVARRAQRASVRRRPTEGTSTGSSARTLGDAVGSHLRGRNVDPDTVSWDAWRREDGRWTLTGSYTTAGRVGAAHFSFDGPGNYVVADDDDAHWLLGEVEDALETSTTEAPDDLSSARRRRLSAVPAEELPLGEDAIELVSDDPEPAAPKADVTAALGAETPVEAYLDGGDTDPAPAAADAESAVTDRSEDVDDADDVHADEPPSRKPVKKTRGRASVPSWDEIMFGGGGSTPD
jgi:Protein of unknown function (DUF3071)